MKKKGSYAVVVAVLSVLIITGCGGLKKMDKYIQELGAKAEPNPLEVHGDSVAITISGKFPPKYFAKKAIVEATPVLKNDGGGETNFKMKGYQGEQAVGNYDKIPYKEGKSFSYSDKQAYQPAMANSKMELRIHGKQGKKEMDFTPVPVADGVITTAYLVKNDDKTIMSTDNFVRTTNKSTEAEVNFDYNSSVVKPAELKQADLAQFVSFLDSCGRNPRLVIQKIEFISYASPEGEILLNDNLAVERADAGKKVLMDMIKKAKLTNVPETVFSMMPKGEDWEGFRAAMEKSNIADRDIIIRILQKTPDLQSREQEIKNISKTYTEIQKDIFPSLRRCRIVLSYAEEGYSDAELTQLGSNNPSVLNYEELMKAGSLVTDLEKRAAIYKTAASKSGADYRASNNLGVIYYMQNKMSDAETQWKKAYDMKKTSETSNHMGIVTRLKGDRKQASKYFGEAGGAKEAKYNQGLIDIQNGNYSSAKSNFGEFKTFNTALAKVLSKDTAGAKADIESSGDTSAIADYLRAIIAARGNESSSVVTNLKSAVQKDGSLGDKAKKDLEFRNFKDAMTF
jgi:tetratricopeptide (TPR) repeat protein/outer membrane protein OmpA-like peptidoglycan-associated protein